MSRSLPQPRVPTLAPFDKMLPILRSHLASLEETRVQLYRQALKGWLLIGGGVFLGLAIIFVSLFLRWFFCAFFFGGGAIGWSWIVGRRWIVRSRLEYVARFKKQFIGPVAESIDKKFDYFLDRMVPEGAYYASQIHPRYADLYAGEDLLEGMIGQTRLRMSELHTKYRQEWKDSKGETRSSWHTIFKGLFVQADFHKNFEGRTFVRPDVAERTMGFIGRAFQKMTPAKDQLIQLEDRDFERAFVVRSTDQIEARYILTPSLMRRLLDVQRRFRTKVSCSFVDSNMFLAIPLSGDLFEPRFGTSVLNEAYLRRYYDQIRCCVGIVEDLGLNTRIWSKM